MNIPAGRGSAACLLLLAGSGALFAAKYAPRLGIAAALAVAAYLAGFALLVFGLGKSARFLTRPWLIAGAYLAAAIPLYLRMDPLALRVDRWSALHNFLRELFAGGFPYGQVTHLGSLISGFPGLFLLGLPFYLLGDVGWMQFAAFLAFVALALRLYRDGAAGSAAILLLLLHPGFEYEVFCRSDLFANMTAVAWLGYALRAPREDAGAWRIVGEGVAWGLALSTRGVVVIPFLVYAGAAWRARGLVRAAAGGTVAAACAVLTLAPFYAWDPAAFLAHNPFRVQTGNIAAWILIPVAVASALLGYRDPAGIRLFRTAGCLLFATVAACFLRSALSLGWVNAFWKTGFDITYFTLATPFLLLGLADARPAGEPPRRAGHSHPQMRVY